MFSKLAVRKKQLVIPAFAGMTGLVVAGDFSRGQM